MTTLLGLTYISNEKVPLADLDDYVTVHVPGAGFNQHLGNHAPWFWSIDRRGGGGVDFKQGKYDYWVRRIGSNQPIGPSRPERGILANLTNKCRIWILMVVGACVCVANIRRKIETLIGQSVQKLSGGMMPCAVQCRNSVGGEIFRISMPNSPEKALRSVWMHYFGSESA
ncbi:hypothetical protein [Agrobacterium tumefaciens]|uniref:hypothetical protein n=1 Tax=Agrobacterium tumefaciens TaxID=358 RepID=UPI0021D32948|nr:hypothetical protein [Agrobacterium tumefaciens]